MGIVESAMNMVIVFGLIGTVGAALLVVAIVIPIIRIIWKPLTRGTI